MLLRFLFLLVTFVLHTTCCVSIYRSGESDVPETYRARPLNGSISIGSRIRHVLPCFARFAVRATGRGIRIYFAVVKLKYKSSPPAAIDVIRVFVDLYFSMLSVARKTNAAY